MLDVGKVYIDARFKAIDSKSDSVFFTKLPRSLNVPDNCVMYIDDIVIPVSWSTIDGRNNKLYLYHELMLSADYKVITIPKTTLDLHSQKH